ncbi:hypothetical protein ACTQ45_03455 [Fundicoccus sp. Sow4_D5]|uniref:hypothetical protein n=1 Tax=unclassified Fundicoccus TaxID=2761543 RepID=UPI003F9159CE
MLIRSKNKNEKIVLGLLSYTYDDNVKTEVLKELLENYRNDDNREIYLYKDDSSGNYVGVMAVEHNQSSVTNSEDEISIRENIMVQRVAVIPSFRNEGIGYKIYNDLRHSHPNATIIGTTTNKTIDLVSKWAQQYNDAQSK